MGLETLIGCFVPICNISMFSSLFCYASSSSTTWLFFIKFTLYVFFCGLFSASHCYSTNNNLCMRWVLGPSPHKSTLCRFFVDTHHESKLLFLIVVLLCYLSMLQDFGNIDFVVSYTPIRHSVDLFALTHLTPYHSHWLFEQLLVLDMLVQILCTCICTFFLQDLLNTAFCLPERWLFLN